MADRRQLDPVPQGKPASERLDGRIARVAGRQHGVVSRTQLLALGLGAGAIDYRLGRGWLHAVHRGVYAVGYPKLTERGRLMAGVLAAGRGAAVSHRAAADLWGVRHSSSPLVEVTVHARRQSEPGLRLYRSRLPDDEIASLHGIPVTIVPRMLLDLAVLVPEHQVERAMHEAEVRRLTGPLSLEDILRRYPSRPGRGKVCRVLARGGLGAAATKSELEARFLTFVDRAGLPRPEVNLHVEVAGRLVECDSVWRSHGVIVELDGRAAHATRRAFETDRARDRALLAAGWRVVRITWRQLHEDGEAVAADLALLLAGPPLGS